MTTGELILEVAKQHNRWTSPRLPHPDDVAPDFFEEPDEDMADVWAEMKADLEREN